MMFFKTLSLSRAAFVVALAGLAAVGSAQTSVSSTAVQLLGNTGVLNGNVTAAYQSSSTGAPVTASLSQNFFGANGAGIQETMSYSGTSTASAEYGHLHVYSAGTIYSSYYNASNSNYAGPNGSINDPNGSPDSISSLTFASFTDTFQFGGALQSGYQAVYVFHADGTQNFDTTNPGLNVLTDLSVHVDGYTDQAFFDGGSGSRSDDWVTQTYQINGVTPQTLTATFSNQTVFNTFAMPDGTTTSAVSDFSNTLSLAGIVVLDQSGNVVPVSQWSVSSGSGTNYQQLAVVPEPSSLVMVGVMGLFGLAMLRRSR